MRFARIRAANGFWASSSRPVANAGARAFGIGVGRPVGAMAESILMQLREEENVRDVNDEGMIAWFRY